MTMTTTMTRTHLRKDKGYKDRERKMLLVACLLCLPLSTATKQPLPKDNDNDNDNGKTTPTDDHHRHHMTTIAFGSCHKRKYALQRTMELHPPNINNSTTIWDVIAETTHPDVFLWTGDTIYPPNRGIASVQELQWEYTQLRENETLGYSNFHPPQGIYGIWDDHDYGGNDLGNEMPQKVQRKQQFLQFLAGMKLQEEEKEEKEDIPSSPTTSTTTNDNYNDESRPKKQQTTNQIKSPSQQYYSKLLEQSHSPNDDHEGLYHSIDLDFSSQKEQQQERKVKIIMLDTRWFRQPHCIPSLATSIPYIGAAISCVTRWMTAGLLVPSSSSRFYPQMMCCNGDGGSSTSSPTDLLGTAQWEWLQEELTSSQAQLTILVSSIQVLTTNPVMESWGHYPQERTKLIHMLNQYILQNNNNHHQNNIGGGGLLLLSGDVHHAEILDVAAGTNAAASSSSSSITPPKKIKQSFLEVTSSGLTHSCTTPFYGKLCEPLLNTFTNHRYQQQGEQSSSSSSSPNNHYHHPNNNISPDYYYTDLNFGALTIDWNASTYRVDIHNAKGEVVLNVSPRSFLHMDPLTTEELDQIPACMDGHLVPYLKKGLVWMVVVLWCLSFPVFGWTRRRTNSKVTMKQKKE